MGSATLVLNWVDQCKLVRGVELVKLGLFGLIRFSNFCFKCVDQFKLGLKMGLSWFSLDLVKLVLLGLIVKRV